MKIRVKIVIKSIMMAVFFLGIVIILSSEGALAAPKCDGNSVSKNSTDPACWTKSTSSRRESY
jgi:hypothetical protein